MTTAIPKWIMQRYSALYRDFKCKESFTRQQAGKIFEKYGLKNDEKLTNTFFSELAERGWVRVERDKEDKRKKIFKLVNPMEAILNLDLKENE
jgi:hypothetical protein